MCCLRISNLRVLPLDGFVNGLLFAVIFACLMFWITRPGRCPNWTQPTPDRTPSDCANSEASVQSGWGIGHGCSMDGVENHRSYSSLPVIHSRAADLTVR
jgi:hypothetical protein